jgi:hypothetical protein
MTAAKISSALQVEAVGVQIGLDAEQAHGDGQHQHDGQVGGQEENDTLHESSFGRG